MPGILFAPGSVVALNRRGADRSVAGLVAAVLVVGGALTWQAVQQQRALDSMGGMMDGSMTGLHGTNPLWYLLGTLLFAAAIVVPYLVVRDTVTARQESNEQPASSPDEPTTVANHAPSSEPPATNIDAATQAPRRVLDLLPDDERRILEPVLDSPGITQIALRDRANFSKSKISQTVSALEKRGLLYRERQGRTYRVYPSDDLQNGRD